jgi:hypothetical protein
LTRRWRYDACQGNYLSDPIKREMDDELKQHLEGMERRINAHAVGSFVQLETSVTAALISLRNSLNAGFDNMHRRFDALEARFDAQDRVLDRQDVVLERWVRAMEAHIERMDKRDASRPS